MLNPLDISDEPKKAHDPHRLCAFLFIHDIKYIKQKTRVIPLSLYKYVNMSKSTAEPISSAKILSRKSESKDQGY